VKNGFSVAELIVAMFVSMLVCGALAVLAGSARTMFRVQPETADLLQRARLGHQLLLDEITAAGAGPQGGREPQPLVRWIPAVLPYARAATGTRGSDRDGEAFRDRITILRVPDLAPQASIDESMSAAGDLVPIVRDAACGGTGTSAPGADGTGGGGTGAAGELACGFAEGQRVLLFDSSPAFDVATVRHVAASSLQLDAGGTSKIYRAADDARVVGVRVTTFSFDAAHRQLRRAAGDGIDVPALDEVVELSFRYFGDPYPPESPRPPPGESNCLFDARGTPRLPVLSAADAGTGPGTGTGSEAGGGAAAAGALIELPLASLSDGPFCGVAPYRFDADLYRVRRVHVRLRVQATPAWLRGPDPRFLRVPDMVVEFDIAPRSLQLR
jgi:hypothetical protein